MADQDHKASTLRPDDQYKLIEFHSDTGQDLCQRCSTISWSDMSRYTRYEILFTIHETLGQWETSHCRMCRLLAKTLPSGYPLDEKPRLEWLDELTPNERCIGSVRFPQWTSGRYYNNFPVRGYPKYDDRAADEALHV
jgi:hypothetical protein